MFFYLIGFLIIIYSLSNFKKGFFCYLIFRIVLVQNITIISIPGVPLLTLEVLMTFFYVMLYFAQRKRLGLERETFPFTVPFIALTISWTISSMFSIVGLGSALSQYVRDVCNDLILIYIMWKIIYSEKDFIFLIKGFLAIITFSCFYGILEGVFESNPLAEYELSLNSDEARLLDFDYSEEVMRGYRVKSIFEHAIGGGVMWAISIVILLLSWSRKEIQPVKWPVCLVGIILCLVCILLTKSRGPMLFLLIAGFGFLQIKSKYFYYTAILCALVLYAGWSFFGQFADNFLSIFSSKAQENVGGSGSEMRIEQFGAAFLLMQQSPIWGLGLKFQNVMDNALTDSLLGSESMWFQIMPTYGLLGVIANLLLAYYSMVKLPLKYHSKLLFFFTLAYWVVGSLTSLPGLKMFYYYFVIIMIIKHIRRQNDIPAKNRIRKPSVLC